MAIPVQEFQIGQRVQTRGGHSFDVHVIALRGGRVEYSGLHNECRYLAIELTLCSERPPYVPSERLVCPISDDFDGLLSYVNRNFRPETDDELAARHAIERAEYEQQDATDVVIYNASGQPIGITGRTGQPGPGAA